MSKHWATVVIMSVNSVIHVPLSRWLFNAFPVMVQLKKNLASYIHNSLTLMTAEYSGNQHISHAFTKVQYLKQ
jgi:hypothetical protein